MRPLRLVLTIALCVPAALLLFLLVGRTSSHVATTASGTVRALLDWRSPSSLFPPSAIISLTDDNSTFFLARPANFGPLLPSDGLSGQLWIGSGFGDDDLSRGIASVEGELGCSDVPGWDEGDRGSPVARIGDDGDKDGTTPPYDMRESRRGRITRRRPPTDTRKQNTVPDPHHHDGTDDHLHHPLPSSSDPKSAKAKSGHADIQSLQESAEIAGKVVLLSRGGCGFLEKVKWVQRRGGTALIVGDNVRGGALITMYAHGDTSNVTIPAIFTSHTTAHLLSSLIPSGSRSGRFGIGDVKRLGLSLGLEAAQQLESQIAALEADDKADLEQRDNAGWLRYIFSRSKSPFPDADDRRPPSSGNVDWVLQEDFDQEAPSQRQSKSKGKRPAKYGTHDNAKKPSSDGFVIGVHDWRDPDLVQFNKLATDKQASSSRVTRSSSSSVSKQTSEAAATKTGSVTPGKGIYSEHPQTFTRTISTSQSGVPLPTKTNDQPAGSTTRDEDLEEERIARLSYYAGEMAKAQLMNKKGSTTPKPHEGLWVTLQPTAMSSSPFFDTLLVLVVSPLVTLTVVYALLLLRSRIRRRRWRAPKSVVERLPVRTYHTISSPTATTTSSQTSPVTSPLAAPDQTTPLLSAARPISQRPRSRTTGEVPMASSSSSFANRTTGTLTLDQIQEKREAGLQEWRRKYGGRQKECVVCLEEYVDGVSQVMSLPCGHEFHAECITPWLTTRRRTCPICKGDVVRSLTRLGGLLSRSSSTGGAANDYDEYNDDYDGRAAGRSSDNDTDDAERDVERGYEDRDRSR